MDSREPREDHELAAGQVQWHSSEEDGGEKLPVGQPRDPQPGELLEEAAVIDGNDIWEALFGIMKGDVPDELNESVLDQLAAALSAAVSGEKAGGLWYRRWFKAQVLNNELTAEIASLRAYMADAQKAESTPSPDTEGVRMAEKLDAIARDMDYAVGGGMMWINIDEEREFAGRIRRVAAALRTAQNTGRDEVLEALPTSTAAKDALERAIKAAGRHNAWPSSRAAKDTEAVVAAIRALSSPTVSTVDEEGGGA